MGFSNFLYLCKDSLDVSLFSTLKTRNAENITSKYRKLDAEYILLRFELPVLGMSVQKPEKITNWLSSVNGRGRNGSIQKAGRHSYPKKGSGDRIPAGSTVGNHGLLEKMEGKHSLH